MREEIGQTLSDPAQARSPSEIPTPKKMSNDECPMTKEIQNPNDESKTCGRAGAWFVIVQGIPPGRRLRNMLFDSAL